MYLQKAKTLNELIETFKNDKSWNTENSDGSHRFDKKIAWIETMIKEYAERFNMPVDKVVELMENKRDYSWPNYYQEANFPPIDDKNLIGVFETFEAFNEYATKHYKGFRCSKCGNVGIHAQLCEHRIMEDGKCDWTSYGLFESPTKVIILESGFASIPIFEPVMKG